MARGQPIPVYPKLTDFLMRGTTTLASAMPGIGKSSYAEALAVATMYERPDLIGEAAQPHYFPGAVVFISNEDAGRIIAAKIEALELHHGLDPKKDQKHRLKIITKGTYIVKQDGKTVTVVAHDLLETLIEFRTRHDIALIIFDTLASTLTGGASDSDMSVMQPYMAFMQRLANACFACILLIAHNSKAGKEGEDIYSVRGSSTIGASVRSAINLRRATPEEAKAYNWGSEDVKGHFVVEGRKGSYLKASVLARQRWFKFVSVDLPAYDPRDGSQTTLEQGIVVPISAPVPKIFNFRDLHDMLSKLKSAVEAGAHVYDIVSIKDDKVRAMDVLGVSDKKLYREQMDDWIERGEVKVSQSKNDDYKRVRRVNLPGEFGVESGTESDESEGET